MPSEKSKTNKKWTSSSKYRESYSRIFTKGVQNEERDGSNAVDDIVVGNSDLGDLDSNDVLRADK